MAHPALRSSTSRLTLAALLLAAAPGVALAQATPEGAQEIQAELAAGLDRIANDPRYEFIQFTGAVTVTPAGASYQATLPALRLGERNEAFEVGVITLDIVPEGDLWQVAATVPSQMPLVRGNGETEATLTIAAQDIDFTWSTTVGNVVGIDTTLEGLEMVGTDGDQARIAIGGVEAQADYTLGEDGYYDGDADFQMTAIEARDPRGRDIFALNQFGAESTFQDFDYQNYNRMMPIMEQMQAPGADPAAAIEQLLSLIESSGPIFSNNADVTVYARGLSFLEPSDEIQVELAELAYSFGVRGLNEGAGSFGFGLQHSGLSVSGGEFDEAPEAVRGLVPSSSRLQLTISNLPNQQLFQLFANSVRQGAGNPFAMQMALFQIPGVLAQGNARVDLNTFEYQSDLIQAQANGAAQFDATSANGVVGALQAEIAGLDQAIPALNNSGERDLQELASRLSIAQVIGQDAGNGTRRYEFELLPDGRVTLNGADLSTIMQNLR